MYLFNKRIKSWALYDFANSAFTTLVVTFIYGTYFTQSISVDEIVGTKFWSWSISLTAIFVAFISPFLGALSDVGGLRKKLIISSTWICIIFTFLLYFPEEGDYILAIFLFTIANIFFEIATVFYNAYLPELAPEKKIGKISGMAWGLGYLGGLLALLISLFLFINPETEKTIFGFHTNNGENIRATNILVAIWYLIFSIPFFLSIKNEKSNLISFNKTFKLSLRNIKRTFIEVKKYKKIYKFLIARLVYNDALITIFSFGGIYAASVIGFSFKEILLMGIILNISAGIGAYLIGFIDDKKGSVYVIKISIVLLSFACLLAIIAPNISNLNSSFDYFPKYINAKFLFWISAILIGFFSGPNQSASRSLMSKLTPSNKRNEFFGFYAFSGKATSFLGPFLFGYMTTIFGNQQAGLIIVFILFIIGYFLIKRV